MFARKFLGIMVGLTNRKSKKLQYFGHIMRRNCLEKNTICGLCQKPGRQEDQKWLNSITDWKKLNLEDLLPATYNRTLCRMIVHSAANPETGF